MSQLTANITWNSRSFGRLLVCGLLPVAFILAGQIQLGLVACIGLLPSAAVPMASQRGKRSNILAVGVLFGLSVVLGSILSHNFYAAVVGITLIAFGAAMFTATSRVALSNVLTALCVPVVGIGFSYPDAMVAIGLGITILLASAWSWSVSMFFPDSRSAPKPAPAPSPQPMSKVTPYAVGYAIATAIPYALGWDHVGWVAGATLFVMRPVWKVQQLRMAGRLTSVAVGALAASLLLVVYPPPWVIAFVVWIVLGAAAATQGSRWYVMPAFSTFLVFFVLLYVNSLPGEIQFRFNERIGETVVGIVIAGTIGWLIVTAQRLHPFTRPQSS